MRNLTVFFFAVLLGQTQAFAVDCTNSAFGAKSIYNIPGKGYWMQSAGKCTITFTGWGGTSSQAFNTCENKPQALTRNVDAWPVPGGTGDDLYVHPSSGNGISFFRFDQAKSTDGHNASIYNDPGLPGVYESVGLLKDNPTDGRIVRVSIGWRAGRLRDYKIAKTGDTYNITPVQPAGVDICGNLPDKKLDTETPILSRDGQMISGRDRLTQKTKIYKIEMPSGQCKELATIPFQTGKPSFSFDNKSLSYIVRDPNTRKGRLMETDIQTGKTRTLSAPDEDVKYMSYKPDGTILYTRDPKNLDAANANSSELVMSEPLAQIPVADLSRYTAIGQMWANACQKEIDDDSATLVGERLTKAVCTDVMNKPNYDSLDGTSKATSLTALQSLCGKSTASRAAPAAAAAGSSVR